jgi:hypothetical protein
MEKQVERKKKTRDWRIGRKKVEGLKAKVCLC